MSKILGFAACAAMAALLAGCKDKPKTEGKAEGLLKKTEAVAEKAAKTAEKAADKAAEAVEKAAE